MPQCEKSIPHLSPTLPAPLGAIASQLERIAATLEELARTAKEKENIPPTPPIREKEVRPSPDTPARTREESDLTCGGMVVPTLDEVKAFAAANGIAADMAEDFHNYCDAMGWRHNGGVIYSWRAMLKAWQRARKRFAATDAKLTAHIDAKMDERERKRERRAGGGRKKADNYIASTPEQVKEFTDGL